jgi:transcriptional regulator with XRE-family HTH domain
MMGMYMSKLTERTRISELRDRANLTQRALAIYLGVTENTIQNWEKGKAGFEQIVRVIKLCHALDCDWRSWSDSQPDIAGLRDRANLALHLGVTENTIQNWEKGKAGSEQIVRVIKLCQALNCDLKDLIDWSSLQEVQQPKGLSLDEIRERLGTSKSRSTASHETQNDPQTEFNPQN